MLALSRSTDGVQGCLKLSRFLQEETDADAMPGPTILFDVLY